MFTILKPDQLPDVIKKQIFETKEVTKYIKDKNGETTKVKKKYIKFFTDKQKIKELKEIRNVLSKYS